MTGRQSVRGEQMRKPAILLGLPFIVFPLKIVLPGASPFQQARAAAPVSAMPVDPATGHHVPLNGYEALYLTSVTAPYDPVRSESVTEIGSRQCGPVAGTNPQ